MFCCQGYATHIVGKWHLGYFEWQYTPLYRGFDTFYGYYNGAEDYWTHKLFDYLDLRDHKSPVTNMTNVYSANMFSKVSIGPFVTALCVCVHFFSIAN